MSTNHSLPNADKCLVQRQKLTDYLLSPFHQIGKEKAKFFKSFGLSIDDVEKVEAVLREHGRSRPVVEVTETEHGVKYVLECSIETPDKRNPCIRTVWIIEAGTTFPRLVTAYPIGK